MFAQRLRVHGLLGASAVASFISKAIGDVACLYLIPYAGEVRTPVCVSKRRPSSKKPLCESPANKSIWLPPK